MDSFDFVKRYHWNYRPKTPRRPSWFTAWPGGARIAVTFNIMHEWESKPGPHTMARRPMPPDSVYSDDFMALGAREYGANFGFWRLLDVLDKHGAKATVIASGLMAELFPESLAEARRRGHEIATHHWDQTVHPTAYKTKEQEREAIVRSIAAIEKATGERPAGYMSPGPRPGPFTLELCAELGFKWNGDYCDSDIPYTIDVNGTRLVSLGYVRPAHSDNDIAPLGLAGALQQLKDDFDAHYEEARLHPMKFRYSMHNFTGGRPGLASVFDKFLQYVKGFPGVWFARCIDMADYWLEQEALHGAAPKRTHQAA
ncbi:MAG TPA: polysaccharide deacetylase family protein [candidate division Zixibacteria bacterium]|nr:polysaccharide deacetylase family protein [candidate division Zixibacteria bacterium]